MALPTESGKGSNAANVCIVMILMVASFVGGILVSHGGVLPVNGHYNTTTTTTTTTAPTTGMPTTGTTTIETTTTPPLPDPPLETTYNLYLRVFYTNGLNFTAYTQGSVILNDAMGVPDDTWTIIAQVGSDGLTGISPVKRHTRVDTVGKSIIIVVESMAWNYVMTLGSSWVRTPDGIGDYMQTFQLDAMKSLECRVFLSPRWTGE